MAFELLSQGIPNELLNSVANAVPGEEGDAFEDEYGAEGDVGSDNEIFNVLA